MSYASRPGRITLALRGASDGVGCGTGDVDVHGRPHPSLHAGTFQILILLAKCSRSKSGKAGSTGRTKRNVIEPSEQAGDVDGGSREHMLQMGLSLAEG